MPSPAYAFDPTGILPANRIVNEPHVLSPMNFQDYHFVVPTFGPFFADSLVVSYTPVSGSARTLVLGVDYLVTHWFISASRATALPIYGSISLLNLQLTGTVRLTYQTLGGAWLIDTIKQAEILADRLRNPRITAWDVVANLPYAFPPISHDWDLVDLVGMSDVTTKLTAIANAILTYQTNGLNTYVAANDLKVIRGWAYAKAFAITSSTRNGSGGLLTANIVWPDGATGVYTSDTMDANFPASANAWHATYNLGGVSRLITQTLITRNASTGQITAQPAITVA